MKISLTLLSSLLVLASNDIVAKPNAIIIAAGSIQYDSSNAAQFTSPETIAALTNNQQVGFTPSFTITSQCNFRVVKACTTIRNATSALAAVHQLQPGAASIETITIFQIEFIKPSKEAPVVTLNGSSDVVIPFTCPLAPQLPILSVPGVGYIDNLFVDVNNVTNKGCNLHSLNLINASSLANALAIAAGELSLLLDVNFSAARCCKHARKK